MLCKGKHIKFLYTVAFNHINFIFFLYMHFTSHIILYCYLKKEKYFHV